MKVGNDAKKKLHSQAGETIAETLISTLIAALALVMLAGAISSAANMINTSKTVMEKYYSETAKMGNPNEGTLTVTLDGVELFDNFNKPMIRYAINGEIGNRPVVTYSVSPVTGG